MLGERVQDVWLIQIMIW